MDFSKQSVAALLLATFSIAAVHALIPSHWLSFAVVGRNQRWTMRRTLTITLLAGTGHILLTMLLGIALTIVGKGLLRTIPAWAEHAATATVLIALGVWFVLPHLRPGHAGHYHGHSHFGHSHDDEPHDHKRHHHDEEHHAHAPEVETRAEAGELAARVEMGAAGDSATSDLHASAPALAAPSSSQSRLARFGSAPTAMGALVLGMTLSPCLDLLSVYVGAAALPWPTLAAMSALMAATTLAVMLLLVWLTMKGLERLHLGWLERNEGLAVGGVLIALGVLLLFV